VEKGTVSLEGAEHDSETSQDNFHSFAPEASN